MQLLHHGRSCRARAAASKRPIAIVMILFPGAARNSHIALVWWGRDQIRLRAGQCRCPKRPIKALTVLCRAQLGTVTPLWLSTTAGKRQNRHEKWLQADSQAYNQAPCWVGRGLATEILGGRTF